MLATPMMIKPAGGPIVYDSFDPATLTADGGLSAGNLLLTKISPVHPFWYAGCAGTIPLTGKVYFEMQYQPGGAITGKQDHNQAGVSRNTDIGADGIFWWPVPTKLGYGLYGIDNMVQHHVSTGYGVSCTPGAWIGFAIDVDALKMWVRNSVGWNGDPAAGTGGLAISDVGSPIYAVASCHVQNNDMRYNPGSSAFQFPVPAGFKSGVYTS